MAVALSIKYYLRKLIVTFTPFMCLIANFIYGVNNLYNLKLNKEIFVGGCLISCPILFSAFIWATTKRASRPYKIANIILVLSQINTIIYYTLRFKLILWYDALSYAYVVTALSGVGLIIYTVGLIYVNIKRVLRNRRYSRQAE